MGEIPNSWNSGCTGRKGAVSVYHPALTNDIEAFLTSRLDLGELAGANKSEAFFVKIDKETNTADNIRQGILVAEVGVALLRPAEFIIFRFSQIQSN